MKTNVKFLSLAFVMMVMSFGLKAQITGDITASAEVQTALTLTKDVDIDFGTISATTPGVVTLDPTGAASANVGTSATVGKFTIGGGDNASVKITWPASVNLVGTNNPTNEMVYSVLVHGNTTDDAAGSASLGAVGVATTADVNLSSPDGDYFLYVGGNLAPKGTAAGAGAALNSQGVDTYAATLTFQLEYN
ncbi:DUF4402 domain-containing protein [Algoriphagus marincola]|uniref:DUF4402 domain-containing protein n=1 Tax=Algoriphagus marincola TaxID=264027 RepID=UPI00042977E6|nr:DUF4402 domain-containing protein [Algoriphagus marincola]